MSTTQFSERVIKEVQFCLDELKRNKELITNLRAYVPETDIAAFQRDQETLVFKLKQVLNYHNNKSKKVIFPDQS